MADSYVMPGTEKAVWLLTATRLSLCMQYVYQAIARTEMLKILGFRFLALADDIDDRSTLTATGFIGVVFFSHSCHKPSPPINGIAPKRPCKYPLRMFSPFLGEKDASEYSSVAQDRSSFSANQI